MTGWTQFTVRFEEARHADAITADAEASGERITHNESLGRIARIRIVGYGKDGIAKRLLEAAGSIELVIVANFNDTTDGGNMHIYRPAPFGDGFESMAGDAQCPEAMRWDFRLEVDGLVETGLRAGNDFTMEEQYG